jgi:hypothetical protein
MKMPIIEVVATRPRPSPGLFIGAVGVGIVALALIAWLGFGAALIENARPTATPKPSALPTASVIAPATLMPLATETTAPLVTPTPLATSAPVVTDLSPTPNSHLPGHHFQVLYDENSLYLLNDSEISILIAQLDFERLGSDGAILNRFDGSRWAQFYASSKSGWCMSIEILQSAPLRPTACAKGSLSTRTPTRDDAMVFWTTVPNSTEFRATWDGVEVARCPVGSGVCEVWLP